MSDKDVRIEVARPPNFEKIAAVFPMAHRPDIIFAYGNIIFNPSGHDISPSLIAHELTHCDRQEGNPEPWWDTYLISPKFRFDEELAAHQVEFFFASKNANRALRRRQLHFIAARLSSPLYGKLCSFMTARDLIKNGRISNEQEEV